MAASHTDIAHRSRRLQRRPKQGPKPVAQPPVADQLPIGPIDGDLSARLCSCYGGRIYYSGKSQILFLKRVVLR